MDESVKWGGEDKEKRIYWLVKAVWRQTVLQED